MKLKRSILSLILITLVYLLFLCWADSRNEVFAKLPDIWKILPLLFCASLVSYLIRYIRWSWLLHRIGNSTPFVSGFLAYLSGFAFTATPGKIGELFRIRYFKPLGVHAPSVIAAFVFERSFDLIAVLILAALYINDLSMLSFVTGFVALFLTVVVIAAYQVKWVNSLANKIDNLGFKKLSSLLMTVQQGLNLCRVWLNPLDILICLGLGLIAWGLTSMIFIYLLTYLGIPLPFLTGLSIYPLAMLAGAASMLPGGLGSTEVAIVALLSIHDIELGIATLSAVCIRFATLWFAIVCGLCSLSWLETKKNTL